MKTLLQFGAGKIGRSFIAQLFSRAGYSVVFVDVVPALLAALNARGRYRIEIKGDAPETIEIENVRAVDGRDAEAVAAEVARADIAAVAVGPANLPGTFPLLAAGLVRRRRIGGGPLDIIICENVLHGAQIFRDGLRPHLPADFPLDESVGLIETSIGKMVPLMPAAAAAADPLLVWAEPFNTLVLDRRGFRNPIPAVPGLEPKDNIAAHVDRKLFVHNLGHTLAAYLQHLRHPDQPCLWQAMADASVREAARRAMWESARGLDGRYPGEFTRADHASHIEDLLRRFANRALGDTVYRVGRDLPRKLGPADRFVGALRLDAEHGVGAPCTMTGLAAGFLFRATDENGKLFPADAAFHADLAARGLEAVLADVCELRPDRQPDARLRDDVTAAHRFLTQARTRSDDWLAEALS